MKRLTFVLDRKVHNRRRAAERRGDRPRFEVVGRRRAAERHVEVRVHVNAARQDVLAGGVDDLVRVDVERRADERDLLVLDEHVAFVEIGGGDDSSAPNQCSHAKSEFCFVVYVVFVVLP